MSWLPAPAKINLHLDITGRNAQGYHLLDTSFVYVDACDRLHVEAADTLRVTCSEPALEGENNLVFRVLAAMRQAYGVDAGLAVHIEKHLPAEAGLGGGSSDAATAMLAANKLWGLNLESAELARLGAPLGADIPCFLFGVSSLAEGIGDKLTPLVLPTGEQHVVLAHPGVGLSTAAVFERFDELHALAPGELTPPEAKATMRAGWRGSAEQLLLQGHNALEAVSVELCSELGRLLAAMRRETPTSRMSGSGTACVAFCGSAAQAEELAGQLTTQGLAAWVHTGKLLPRHPLHGSGMQPVDWGVAKR